MVFLQQASFLRGSVSYEDFRIALLPSVQTPFFFSQPSQHAIFKTVGCSRQGAKPLKLTSRVNSLGVSALDNVLQNVTTLGATCLSLRRDPGAQELKGISQTPHFLFQGVDSKLTADSESKLTADGEPPAGKNSGGTPHVKQLVSWPLAVLIALLLLLSLLRQLALRFPPTSAY